MQLCFRPQNFALRVELVEYVSPNDLVDSLTKERLVPDDVAWKRCMFSSSTPPHTHTRTDRRRRIRCSVFACLCTLVLQRSNLKTVRRLVGEIVPLLATQSRGIYRVTGNGTRIVCRHISFDVDGKQLP
jgi:hypothetical protein